MGTGRLVTIPSRMKFSNCGRILYRHPSKRRSFSISPPFVSPLKRTNCMYAPGMKYLGFFPNITNAAYVGQSHCILNRRRDASCSLSGRLSVANVSASMALGRYSLMIVSVSMSSIVASRQGLVSYVGRLAAQRSARILSSSALAMSRRGPILMNVLPR